MSKYRTIVADPPWPIRWTGGERRAGKSSGSTRVHIKRKLPYTVMTVEAICDLRVAEVANDDAHLFLWTLDAFLIDGSATKVARAWGFEPLPRLLVWRKNNPGLGMFIRPAHELILIARRGEARFNQISDAVSSVFNWQQPYRYGAKEHSAKPPGFLDFVEELSPGPYLELFSRHARLGWDTHGDESLHEVAV